MDGALRNGQRHVVIGMNRAKPLVDMNEFNGGGVGQDVPLRVWRTLRGFACRKAPQREG